MNSSTFRCLVESPLGGAGVWKTMVLDPPAAIRDPSKPPPVSAPPDSPPYFGHPLVPETAVDGWCLGVVTDPFEADTDAGCTLGDAFVQAPDGTRAGWCGPSTPSRDSACCAAPRGRGGACSTSRFSNRSRI